MATQKNNSPYATTSYGIPDQNQGLFTPPAPPKQPTPKQPSAKQLKEQQQKQREAEIAGVINSLRSQPEWASSTPIRKRELLDQWTQNQWGPIKAQIEDPLEAAELEMALLGPLRQDITAQEQQASTGRLGDTWQGAVAATGSIINQAVNQLPAAYQQSKLDDIDQQLAVYQDMLAQTANAQPPTADGVMTQARAAQENAWLMRQYAEREIAKLTAQRESALASLNTNVQEAQQYQATIDQLRNDRSYGQQMRDLRVQELQQAGSDTPMVDAILEGGIGDIAANIGQLAAENAPSVAVSIGAAGAGQLVGIPAPVTLATVGGALGAGDAGGSSYDAVMQMTPTQLSQSPEYQSLLDMGHTHDSAKAALAARAYSTAAPLGAATGAALNLVGPEAILTKGLSPALRGAISNVATRTGAPRVATALGTTALGAASEYPDEYLQAVASNYGQQQATGIAGDLTAGAHEQGLVGVLAGGPVSVVGGVSEAIQSQPQQEAAPQQQSQPQDSSTGFTRPPEDFAAEPVTPSPSPAPSSGGAAVDAFAEAAVSELTSQGPVTIDSLQPLFERARAAQVEGMLDSDVEAIFANIQMNRGFTSDTSSIFDEYNKFIQGSPISEQDVTTATVNESAPIADAVANAVTTNTIDEVVANGNFDTTGTIPTNPTGIDINSRMETYSPTSYTTTATISNENATSVSGTAPVTGIGRTTQPQQFANVSNQASDARVGDVAATGAINRPDNQPVSTVSETERVSTGSLGDSTSQRTNNVGGTESLGSNTAGVNALVGNTVSWNGGFKGARTLTGVVDSVMPNGKINLRVGDQLVGNLAPNKIVTANGVASDTGAATDVTGVDEIVMPTPEDVAPPLEFTVTPSGYDTETLMRKADRLLEREDMQLYAVDALALSDAIERGNLEEAGEIAQYLYAEGLRQFAPPQVNTGEGGATLESAMQQLSPPERLGLQNAYAQQRDAGELTADMDSYQAWVGTMVQSELEVQSGAEPLTPLLARVSEGVRNVIRKLATALQAIVLAVTINYALPINDAVAAQGYANVGTVAVQEALSQPANVVNGWVTASHDNNGQRYIIADKASGMVHIMNADGTVLESAPALYGKKQGDGMTIGETPAGAFLLHHQPAPASYGGDLQQFATAPDGDIYAIHRVLTTNPKQNRVGRLNTPTAEDNRVSLGCINIPADIYDTYLSTGFQGKLYILPDQKALSDVFAGIEEQNAKFELREGQSLPQELNDGTSQDFNNSTSMLADSNMDASGTIVSADVDAVADSVSSEQSNPVNDGVLAGMLLAGLVRRRNARNGEPRTSEETPEPPLGDMSAATDEIPDSASGMTEVPTEHVRAPRKYTTAKKADRMRALAWKLRNAYADAATPLLEWLHTQAERIMNGEYDTHPVWQTWNLVLGRRDAAAKRMKQQFIQPFIDAALQISKRTGREIGVVSKDLATWTTAMHIRDEASVAHRRHLQQAMLATVQLPPDQAREQYMQAAERLRAYDAYQAGNGQRVPTPGGMSNIEADRVIRYIESLGYSAEELASAQKMLVDAAQGATRMRIENGTLTEDDLRAWQADSGFENYIPLYVDHSYDGFFLGTSTYNPVGDFRREGVMNSDRLLNAVEAVTQYINRAAAEVASAPFKSELNAMYQRMRERGDTHGLNRYNLATDPSMVPQEARDARGFVYTERNVQPDGTVKVTRYKLWFSDANITNALLGQVTTAHALEMEASGVTSAIHNATRWYSRYITQYDPQFAPSNMMKDFMERTSNMVARDMQTVSGTTVSGATLAARTLAHGANPRLMVDIAKALMKQDYASFYGKYFKELEDAGGLSTMTSLLARDSQTLLRDIKSNAGWRSIQKEINDGVSHWNEVFNLAPVIASHTAMRESGVGVEDAAFRTLDLLNYRKQGQTVQNLKLNVLYPFIKPVFQSGANIARTLGFSPGQDNWLSPSPQARRGRVALAGMVVAGTILHALASSVAGEDDDLGNRIDALPMSSISRFIPFYFGDNNDRYIKIPVGYGLPQIAWVTSVALDRARRGVMSYGDATSEIALAFAKNMMPDTAPEFSFKDHPIEWVILSVVPPIFSGPTQVGLNINTFGTPITSGSRTLGNTKAESGKARTPDVWKSFATEIQEVTGLDFFPEQLRHMVNSYALGPLRGMQTWLESEDNFKAVSGLSTQQEQGWVASTLGIQKWWGNDYAIASRMYYTRARRIEKFLVENDIQTTSPDNRGKPGAKEQMIARQLAAKGVAPDKINDIILYFETSKDIAAANKKLREQVKVYGQHDLTSQDLKPTFEANGKAQEAYMRRFIRNTGVWK